jgi:integrase
MRWNLIARNATELVTPPRGARHDFITFTLDQARCFLDAVKGDRLEALYVLALTTGMREGELFELQWADVNFAAARFTWSSSSRRDRHSGTSCWSASRRTRLGATSPGSARSSSCSASNGTTTGWSSPTPWASPAPLQLPATELPSAAGTGRLPRIRFHDPRRSAATLLLGLGIHPRIVIEMLGHSQIVITLDLYSHVTATMQQEAARAFEGLPGSQVGSQKGATEH